MSLLEFILDFIYNLPLPEPIFKLPTLTRSQRQLLEARFEKPWKTQVSEASISRSA